MKPAPATYVIKPKYIFKTPFLKYDLQNPTNREAQNEQLTEYFNYGFNEDTMNIYVKLVNRMLKVLDHKKNLEYFDQPSQLMRLNDQIPMDLGGFCKFYDPELFKNEFIQNDEQLLKNFLFNIVKATWINGKQNPTYPMLQFVKSMYPPKKTQKQGEQQQNNLEFQDNPLPSMIEQISKNLQKKYEQTMKKLIEQKNQPKQLNPSSLPYKKSNKFDKKPRFGIEEKQQQRTQQRKKQRQNGRQRDRKKRQSSSSSSSSDSSSSSSSDSSSQSEDERRKRRKDKRGDRKDDRKDDRRESSKRKNKRSRSKDRKVTKERKESRHGPSRYDDRDRDRERDRKQKKRSQRSRSRDHKRSRR